MSNFITYENQTLLWNTITNVPLFNKIPHQDKANWFKNIIGNIHQQNENRYLSSHELHDLNKYTISYMISILKQINDMPIQTNTFEEKQREYDNMKTKQAPPEPNFKEHVEDTAIENMDELIKQHQQQRQMDLNITNTPLQNQEDKKQINDLKEEVTSLKSTIETMQDQMNELRKEIVYSNVNNTIENIKKTVEFNLSV